MDNLKRGVHVCECHVPWMGARMPASDAGLPALSADVLSSWSHPADHAEHVANVRQATRDLLTLVLPEYARALDAVSGGGSGSGGSSGSGASEVCCCWLLLYISFTTCIVFCAV